MDTAAPRSRAIPLSRRRLLCLLLEEEGRGKEERDALARVAAMLSLRFHVEFHRRKESMKQAWSCFYTEEGRKAFEVPEEERKEAAGRLAEDLDFLLTRANYARLSFDEVDRAMREQSTWKIGVKVDVGDFEEVVIHRRGEMISTETLRTWFGLRERRLRVPAWDRVCIFVRFKDQDWFDRQGRKHLPFRPGSVYLKLFHRIPKADLEMLFPNVQVRMRMWDRLLIGVPATVGFVPFLAKLGSLSLTAVFVAMLFFLGLREEEPDLAKVVATLVTLGVLLAYLYRQWDKFKNRKLFFLKVLTENLYFRSLDTGAGVFLGLVDAAEEAEVKEAILAYECLLRSPRPLDGAELDEYVEGWLRRRAEVEVDFDHVDALDKLLRLGLVTRDRMGRHQARPLDEALRLLDEQWDAMFDAEGRCNQRPSGAS